MVSPMSRRLIGRLLLSFALLWSQQAALAHTLSHLLQADRAASSTSGRPAKSLVTERSCADCLGHAQFFSALGSAQRSMAVDKSVPLILVVPATQDDCGMTMCVFQARAPPPA